MSHYDEMRPMMLENGGKILSGWGSGAWHRSERRCTECHWPMATNGLGAFHCNGCGHEDRKDVKRYADLRYRVYKRRRFGSVAHAWGE